MYIPPRDVTRMLQAMLEASGSLRALVKAPPWLVGTDPDMIRLQRAARLLLFLHYGRPVVWADPGLGLIR